MCLFIPNCSQNHVITYTNFSNTAFMYASQLVLPLLVHKCKPSSRYPIILCDVMLMCMYFFSLSMKTVTSLPVLSMSCISGWFILSFGSIIFNLLFQGFPGYGGYPGAMQPPADPLYGYFSAVAGVVSIHVYYSY